MNLKIQFFQNINEIGRNIFLFLCTVADLSLKVKLNQLYGITNVTYDVF
jgi:hypothetical protein